MSLTIWEEHRLRTEPPLYGGPTAPVCVTSWGALLVYGTLVKPKEVPPDPDPSQPTLVGAGTFRGCFGHRIEFWRIHGDDGVLLRRISKDGEEWWDVVPRVPRAPKRSKA